MADGAELAEGEQLYPTLKTVNLSYLCGSKRFKELDKLEAYYRCTQYDGRRYDWNGNMRGYGQAADIEPGYYVPLAQRRPSARYNLARLIVRRFTAMIFGTERFPELMVDGDDDAQDYVRALARAAKLPARMQELRRKGGAQGSVGASFGFVGGKPRLSIHNAKHITILRWEDRYEHRPAEVLESWAYPRTVWDKDGKSREITMYFARYWNEQEEVTWDPIPAELARTQQWQKAINSTVIEHGYGFCPFYWIQNQPDSDEVDGESDYEGQCDTLDQINILLSATSKGTVANVDPTLVIHDDPQTANKGSIRKGSENAIYSKGGAKYLELTGESLKAGLALLKELKQETLDTVGVILGDPDTMSSKVSSAAALRMLYMPMLTESDVLRDQYGTAMVQLLGGMLMAAKQIAGRDPGQIVTTEDGQKMQQLPSVKLPQRAVAGEGDGPPTMVDRVPGESEEITLNWPPYFPNTWQDTKEAVNAVQAARGGQSAIISRKTAVENVAPLLGITDVDEEMDAIDEDAAKSLAMMQASMEANGGVGVDPNADKDDDDDGDGDGEDEGGTPGEG